LKVLKDKSILLREEEKQLKNEIDIGLIRSKSFMRGQNEI
jgi:hypothetical protein